MTPIVIAWLILLLLWPAARIARRAVRPWAEVELGLHLAGWFLALRLLLPGANAGTIAAASSLGGIALVMLQARPAIGLDRDGLGCVWPRSVDWVLGLASGVVLAGLAAMITSSVRPVLGEPRSWIGSPGVAVEPVVVVALVFLVPFFEELYFRGVVQGAIARRSGMSMAVLGSATVFSVVHMDLAAVPGLWFLGVGFGLLRWKTGSILPSVVAHGINNLIFIGHGSV